MSAGPHALPHVRFLVADASLTFKYIQIGLPVLRHLGVDTKTLFGERRDLLNGPGCSKVD